MITAFSPPNVEYTNVIEHATTSVFQPGQLRTISPNFMAAKLTAPMTNTLKMSPK